MRIQNEKGAVAVLVAVMLVLLIVCVALVVDLGHLHNVKVQMQRAVDAAALAGALQLDGEVDETTRVTNVAKAIANQNIVGAVPLSKDAVAVTLGAWDSEAIGSSASDRFDASNTTKNAVYVKAAQDVEHAFFSIISDSTTITADAIAVAAPVTPVLPIALVSCIPTDESGPNAGSLPGTSVCDIRSYNFKVDQDDTSAWTSLTFKPASKNNIEEFLTGEQGRKLFNQVVFGKGLPGTNGIENEQVDTNRPGEFDFAVDYPGCVNNNLGIDCGLGRIAGKDIARPDEFPEPLTPMPPLTTDATGTYYIGDTTFDPLSAYDPLPRWYNIHNDDGLDDHDHFARIWSQDGILLQGPTETDADYAQRLLDLKDGVVKPYGDNRFVEESAGGGGLVHKFKGDWVPNFQKAAQYAGYPKVFVNNGVEPTLLEDFLEGVLEADDSTLDCDEADPFGQGKAMVRVNVPVIFAGSCDEWKALSNSDEHVLTYVGMAKFLLTRAWHTNTPYACAEDERVSGSSCPADTFDPPLDGAEEFGPVSFNTPAAMEGLNLEPEADDEDAEASILKVYLVE